MVVKNKERRARNLLKTGRSTAPSSEKMNGTFSRLCFSPFLLVCSRLKLFLVPFVSRYSSKHLLDTTSQNLYLLFYPLCIFNLHFFAHFLFSFFSFFPFSFFSDSDLFKGIQQLKGGLTWVLVLCYYESSRRSA